jgi:hypothetical protein
MVNEIADSETVTIRAVQLTDHIQYEGVETELMKLHPQAYKKVSKYLDMYVQRFANGGMDDGMVIGESSWTRRVGGTYDLEEIDIRDTVQSVYGNDQVEEDDVEYPDSYLE